MLKPMNRCVHFDFHTMPGIDNFGANFDAEKFALQMKEANVDYVNMFARCNIGFSYYPTKVGVAYPNMNGNMFGSVVRECHKRNIGVTGYLNVGINHEAALRHPEWLLMRKNGKTYDFENGGGNAFRAMCYNSAYADYFIEEIKEVLAEGADGVFCDCYNIAVCYCQKCLDMMRHEGMDPTDDKAVEEFSKKTHDRFLKRIRAAVPEDKRFYVNGLGVWGGRNINTHYEVECLPSHWGYDYFYPNAAFARTVFDTVVYMNGRFQICWGDFGGYKGRAALENDFYDALTQGVIPMLGDHLHPAELAEADIYRDLGEIYESVKRYEKWTRSAKFIPEIAILTKPAPLGTSMYGAARMLSELKYNYDIVCYEADFSKYPLIIIPDDIIFDDELANKVSEYLKNGGKVISSGTSALSCGALEFALPEWSFEPVSYVETDGGALISHGAAGFTYYFTLNYENNFAKMRYSAYETAISMKAGVGNISLADEHCSYFDKYGFDGRHYIFYTPPKEPTGNSVMAVTGAENVAHIAFPIFYAYRKSSSAVYRDMVKTLIERFMPNNLIKTQDMPSTSRITLTGNDEYKLLHVKVTYPEIKGTRGIIEEHNELLPGKTVAVKGEYSCAVRLPDEKPIGLEVRNGYSYLTLPSIVGYDMFLLK